MKTYDPKTFTYGFELEIGDVPRDLPLPEHLGTWEHSETDVLNLHSVLGRMVCCDPLGIDPPFGGEINTKPTNSIGEQVDRILAIVRFYEDAGFTPTTNCISHNHKHIHVPGLTEDIDALKRLTKYIMDNQEYAVDHIYAYKPHSMMKQTKSTSYFKFDGGRLMPNWMCRNIIEKTTDFDSFIQMHANGKDGVSRGRPFRYAFNTYCLKHTQTIEFRFFRHSLDYQQLMDSFRFARDFVDAALNGGPNVKEIISNGNYSFPPFEFNPSQCVAWKNTKYDSSRGKKERHYYEVK